MPLLAGPAVPYDRRQLPRCAPASVRSQLTFFSLGVTFLVRDPIDDLLENPDWGSLVDAYHFRLRYGLYPCRLHDRGFPQAEF